MAHAYKHFCPVARTLERIGDKWSLLIIRDLLPGPQRFTDLLGYLNNITPKWLTQRLRELESAGIVERDSKPGRRQVSYRLTPAGRNLSPVVDALSTWGFRYAMRPPLPGEVVHPDLLMRSLISSLNKSGKRLTQPVKWLMRFPKNNYCLSFDQKGWSSSREEVPKADVKITTTPEIWATVFTAPRSDRSCLAKAMQIEGRPERIEEFRQTFGIQTKENKPVFASMSSANRKKRTNKNLKKEKKRRPGLRINPGP